MFFRRFGTANKIQVEDWPSKNDPLKCEDEKEEANAQTQAQRQLLG